MPAPYETVENQYILDFTAQLHSITQERMSKLTPYVTPKNFEGGYLRYIRAGQMARPEQVTQRFQDVNLTDFAWDTRWAPKKYLYLALGMDAKDRDQLGRDITPEMIAAAGDSIQREIDKRIYAAVEASVLVGHTPAEASSVTATTDGVEVLDATGGFSLATLAELKRKYVDDGVVDDMRAVPGAGGSPNDLMLAIGGEQEEDLLGETQLTSIDFVNDKPLTEGRISRAYGINLERFGATVQDPLMPAASSERRLISIARGGLCMALERPQVIIQDRNDKLQTKQAVLMFAITVIRTEGKRVKVVRVAA